MLESLRIAEREIFGDTSKRSRLVILPPRGGTVVRVQPDQERWPGLRYLGYGLFEQAAAQAVVTRQESHPESPPLASVEPITVRLDLRPIGPRDRITTSHQQLLAATIWLWLHFGGIGARTRRGWGSVGLEADQNGLLSGMAPAAATSIPALIDALLPGLDQATAIFRDHLPQLPVNLPGGARPHPAIRSIEGIETVTVLPGEHVTPIRALDAAGRLFVGFRSTLARRRFGMPPLPDYHSVKASLQTRTPARKVERAAFGLPLPFYFRSLGGAKTRFIPGENKAEDDRLASPLLFRVHRIGSGRQARYVTALVNLADRMDPMCGRKLFQVSPSEGPTGRVGEVPTSDILKSFVDWAIKEANRTRGGK